MTSSGSSSSHQLFMVILMRTSPEFINDFKHSLGMSAEVASLPCHAYSKRDEWVEPSAYINYVINHILKNHPYERAAFSELSDAHEIIEILSEASDQDYIVISSDDDEEPIASIIKRREKKKRLQRNAALTRVIRRIRRKQKRCKYIEISSDDESAPPAQISGPSSACTKVRLRCNRKFGPKTKRNTIIVDFSEDDLTAVE